MYDDGILLEPKLIYLSYDQGSSAGGVIYATIIAAGVDDDYTLLNGSDDICESTRMVAYSLLECVVKATTIETDVTLSVEDKTTGAVYECGNEASPESCQYQTISSDYEPTIESYTNGGDTLTITGTNFDQSSCQVTVLDV